MEAAAAPGRGQGAFLRWVGHRAEVLIMVLMAGMTLLAFAQVVARYVFNYSFTWALEVTGVCFAWLIFVGMSYGVRVGSHIGVDALVRVLPRGVAKGVGMVAAVLSMAYALVLGWGACLYVQKMYLVGIEMQDVPIQQWIPRIVLPVGFALLALRFAQALWQIARGERVGLLVDEAQDALKLRQDGGEAAGAGP